MKQETNLKIDMHVHTHYSSDANIAPTQLDKILHKKQLDGAAIVDQGTLKGYHNAKDKSEKLLIPGTELITSHGEVIAIFITEEVRSKEIIDVSDEIHAQGGLMILPHPFDLIRRRTFQMRKFSSYDLEKMIDAIEVLNSRCIFSSFNRKAQALAEKLQKTMLAGSDAHLPFEVGKSYTFYENTENLEDVYKAIKNGKTVPCGKMSPFFVHIFTATKKFTNLALRKRRSDNRCL